MKINILQQDLLPALQAVARSVGTRVTLPVLDNILLSTEGNKLKLAATNLEIGVIKLVGGEIIEPGEITVPAKTLVEIVSGLKQAKLNLEADQAGLTVSADKFKATINGIPASEFPAIPLGGEDQVSFKTADLKLCEQILFAAAVDEGRPILTGVLTDVSGERLDFVATDGFRLAHRRVTLPKSKNQFKSLIPRRTFEEVLRVIGEESLDESKDEVTISVSPDKNQAIFKVGQTIISSRLIEGQFPAWEKIIPESFSARVVVEKDELLRAVKLASVFAKSEGNIVILKLTNKQLLLESSAKELGSQHNEVEAQIEGESLEIAFNSRFLSEAVVNSPAAQLIMEFSGPLSPTLVKPMGIEGLEYIIMPVRLN